VLALCLGVTAMAFLRLPNLMVASVVLWLFFFYDIFWVFLSPHFFGKNVMYASPHSLVI
jgi:signal peptide peptidase-like protein 2B